MPDLLVRSFAPLLLAFQSCFTQPSFREREPQARQHQSGTNLEPVSYTERRIRGLEPKYPFSQPNHATASARRCLCSWAATHGRNLLSSRPVMVQGILVDIEPQAGALRHLDFAFFEAVQFPRIQNFERRRPLFLWKQWRRGQGQLLQRRAPGCVGLYAPRHEQPKGSMPDTWLVERLA